MRANCSDAAKSGRHSDLHKVSIFAPRGLFASAFSNFGLLNSIFIVSPLTPSGIVFSRRRSSSAFRRLLRERLLIGSQSPLQIGVQNCTLKHS